jgi:hypothetical protein
VAAPLSILVIVGLVAYRFLPRQRSAAARSEQRR